MRDLPLLSMFKERMRWQQARQKVLAENVASAEVPGYRARDLREPDFVQAANGMVVPAGGQVSMAVTEPGHMAPSGGTSTGTDPEKTYEITPEGNNVVLEEEVMRVSQNAMDFQTVSQLYTRSLGLLRTAARRSA